MRRVFACSLVIALVGCGGDDSRSEPSTPTTAERVTSSAAEMLAPTTAPEQSTSTSTTTTMAPTLTTTVPTTTDPVEDAGDPGIESIGVTEKITITIRDAEDG